MCLPLTPEAIPHVSLRLRMGAGTAVHRGDLDTGRGITTMCGRYALTGRYEPTDEAVTCRICLRSLVRRGELRDN
jgi:hypothetical protein